MTIRLPPPLSVTRRTVELGVSDGMKTTIVEETAKLTKPPVAETIAPSKPCNKNKNINNKRVAIPIQLPPVKRPRLFLANDDSQRINSKDLLIGSDPPKSWPDTIRRMWRYCHAQLGALQTDLVVGMKLVERHQQDNPAMMERDVVSVVMAHLVKSWGAPALAHVSRQVMTMGNRGQLWTETGTANNNSKGENPSANVAAFVDLTLDVSDDNEGSDRQDGSQSLPPSLVSAALEDSKQRSGDEKATTLAVPEMKATHTQKHKEVSLETLANAAAMAMSSCATNNHHQPQHPPSTTTTTTTDLIQIAVAYGFDLARRYGTNAPAVLCQEAARTIRFMSPCEREHVWKSIVEESKAVE